MLSVVMMCVAFYLLLSRISLWLVSLCWMLLCGVSHFIYCDPECHYVECHYVECYCAVCRILFIVIHNVIMLSVIMWVSLCWMSLCWVSWRPSVLFTSTLVWYLNARPGTYPYIGAPVSGSTWVGCRLAFKYLTWVEVTGCEKRSSLLHGINVFLEAISI